MTEKALWKVSNNDGSRPIEILAESKDGARRVFAKYYNIPVSSVKGYDYLRISPKGMI
jgi:hypothetical protein